MNVDPNILAQRWPLPTGSAGDAVRDDLLSAWAAPERGYHDLRHLTEVLDRLDELAAAGETYPRRPTLLAAWFHDGVYDGAENAEERSARWAERALAGLVEPGVAAETARLVRLTAAHRPEPGDAAGAALTDADLAILASGQERYAEYAAGVRREYAHVRDDVFAAGRTEILESLLAKPHLFHTSYARARWETVARTNIAAEIRQLSS